MNKSTERALWIGGGAALAAAVVGGIAYAASKPSPAATPTTPPVTPPVTPPAPSGQQFTFTQGHQYAVTLVLPASVPLPTSAMFNNALGLTFPGLFTVVNVTSLPPSRVTATVNVTGPTQTVDLSTLPYTGATFLANDLGPIPPATTPPVTTPNPTTLPPNLGPTITKTVVAGLMKLTVYAGTTVVINAPTGGRFAGIPKYSRTYPNLTAGFTETLTWSDPTGSPQTTTLTVLVI